MWKSDLSLPMSCYWQGLSYHGFTRKGINPPTLIPPTSHHPWTPATSGSLAAPQGKHYINVNVLRNCYWRSHSQHASGKHMEFYQSFFPICHSSGGSWKCSSDLGSDLLTYQWTWASVTETLLGWQNVQTQSGCACTHTHVREWLQKILQYTKKSQL